LFAGLLIAETIGPRSNTAGRNSERKAGTVGQ
jgi:hypothetical protein